MKITLKRLSSAKYSEADTFFRSNDAKAITRDYFNYIYTSCLDYLDTGDVNVLNRMVAASSLAQRVRVTKQLISLVACHKIMNGRYKGKANVKRLKMLRNKQDELKEKQEAIINRDHDKKEQQANTFNQDQVETRAVNALATLLAHNVDVDLKALLKAAQDKQKDVKVKNVLASSPVTVVAAAEEPKF